MPRNEIDLNPSEITQACLCGVMRQVENIKLKRKPKYGAGRRKDWQYALEGMLGEFAMAKFLGVYLAGKGEFRGLDVGRFDVRKASLHHWKLVLHPDDPDDRIFWHITGLNGSYIVHGWIQAKFGKLKQHWADPTKKGRPAFFVPNEELNSWEVDPFASE